MQVKPIELPIDYFEKEIAAALDLQNNLVLVAEPGAGKTTRLPRMAQKHFLSGLPSNLPLTGSQQKVAVLEPRRIAAKAAAIRVAEETATTLKQKVGYAVRFEMEYQSQTEIIYWTSGLFRSQIQHNPQLNGYHTIVFDEFHERSLDQDFLLAYCKELQCLDRPDLRIIVMSATLDAKKIANFLAKNDEPAPIVLVPGRSHPLTVNYAEQPLRLAVDPQWITYFSERIYKTWQDLIEKVEIPGLLVFVPGAPEIRQIHRLLAERLLPKKPDVFELHGQLSLAEQSKVVKSDRIPKIILATNIAESSLTLSGINGVLDSGIQKTLRSDRVGFESLKIERISLASIAQRAGRAGRESAGFVYRSWSRLDEIAFPEHSEAEIFRADLTSTYLELLGHKIAANSFSWFEPPTPQDIAFAIHRLKLLGLVTDSEALTELGQKAIDRALSLHPRFLRILLEANKITPYGRIPLSLCAELIALLSERDPVIGSLHTMSTHSAHDSDLEDRHSKLRSYYSGSEHLQEIERSSAETILRVARRISDTAFTGKDSIDSKLLSYLLLTGYPDRVCIRRKVSQPEGLMVGGRGVKLAQRSLCKRAKFFIALRGESLGTTDREVPVGFASPLESEVILADNRLQESVTFRVNMSETVKEKVRTFLDLPIEAGRPIPLSALEKKEAEQEFINREFAEISSKLCASDEYKTLERRLQMACTELNQQTDPVKTMLVATKKAFLQHHLVSDGTIEELVAQFDFTLQETILYFLAIELNLKESQLKEYIKTQTPTHFLAPTGNRFKINYLDPVGPVVEVRLQELFGTLKHPLVLQKPLIFRLLSPGYKPIQVTADLPSFWKGSYIEVRKELRARYPKHSWPEDPSLALPVSKGRPIRS